MAIPPARCFYLSREKRQILIEKEGGFCMNSAFRKKKHRISGAHITRWLFVLPAMVVVICLLIYPVLSTVFYSFTNRTMIRTTFSMVGFKNYIAILTDKNFYNAFVHSLIWTIGSVAAQLIVGFIGALCLNRVKNRVAKSLFRIICIIPWAFPAIATAMTWKWMLNGIYGFVPTLLMNLGLSDGLVQFLSSSGLAMPTMIFINVWFGAPLIMVNVYAALQTIPQDQYEAAQIDGANGWQSFGHITVPHIRTVVGLLVVLRTVWVFNNFDLIYMITSGGPAGSTTTMPLYIYDTGWTGRMVGKASAASILLLLFLIIITVLYFSVIGRWEKEDK